MADTTEKSEPRSKKKFAESLESTPPEVPESISDLLQLDGRSWVVAAPDLQLHCSYEQCQGVRFFHCASPTIFVPDSRQTDAFMTYVCRNCRRTFKTYALRIVQEGDHVYGAAMKYGEQPSFGPPIPSRVISLIGPDRELFLRGRRGKITA